MESEEGQTSVKVFYSWQSWTSHKTNRTFIQGCIAAAIERANSDLGVELELDHDIKDRAGTVAIADEILEKIDQCLMFVCDVTFVTVTKNDHESGAPRLIPNPNVMIELGYAARSIGWKRIICVANLAHGPVESLPFDLRHRSMVLYSLDEDGDEDKKEQEKQNLTNDIYGKIRTIVEGGVPSQSVGEQAQLLIGDPSRRDELDRLITSTAKRAYDEFASNRVYQQTIERMRKELSVQEFEEVVDLYLNPSTEMLDVMARLARSRNDDEADHVVTVMSSWLESPRNTDQDASCYRFFPAIFLIYSVGVMAASKGNWVFLKSILTKPRIRGGIHRGQKGSTLLDQLRRAFFAPIGTMTKDVQGHWLSDYLEKVVFSIAESYFPSDAAYLQRFDLFGMLLALIHLDTTNQPKQLWIPPHKVYLTSRSHHWLEDFWTDAGKEGAEFTLLKTGLFGGKTHRLRNALGNHHRSAETMVSIKSGLELPPFLHIYEDALPGKITSGPNPFYE